MNSMPEVRYLPAFSRFSKARTFTSPVFFEELNAGSLNGIPNFLSRVFPATQVAVGSLQTSNRRLRYPGQIGS